MDSQDLFDLGLQADLAMVTQSPISRRRVLKLGLLGISALVASCMAPSSTSSSTSTGSVSGCVSTIPAETAGPYPADGSNASNQTLNALALTGIVRSDIRTSLTTRNVAQGVPLTIELTLVNTNASCAPLPGYAVYLWHCTRDGDYSLYSSAVTAEDYLRGVQASDSEGKLIFKSIFPGCYSGRWPHIHFEVYPSLEKATGSSNLVHTSQMALVEEVCKTVYAADGYANSVENLTKITLSSDNVFGDGSSLQLATMTGDVTNGYTAALTVGIAV
ncbi:MAG: dioxygenase family protein [Anaerolineales bacterium]